VSALLTASRATGAASGEAARGTVPTLVLGGSGYVAGEVLRLLAGHPHLAPAAVFSESQPGEPVAAAFPHLAGCLPPLRFEALDRLDAVVAQLTADRPQQGAPLAAVCAAPHGAAAPLVDALLDAAERRHVRLHLVDLSADFRFADAAEYSRVYGHPHRAPHRLAAFHRGLPEHARQADAITGPVAHPGCFPTAVLLAGVPLLAGDWIEPELVAVAVTGSTGAGRTPGPTTHHPARRSNLFAYAPLSHRHQPEMRQLAAAATGKTLAIHFVPQAGPFARGIYATLSARLRRPAEAAEIAADLAAFYDGAPFVAVSDAPPRLQDVVGTNRCHLAVAVAGDQLVAFSALDNLTKGAAGGAIQWLNRLLGFPETAGLLQPGLGWF
jgi:N-acetyl-gamma-glutamyl-phosphate reductase common form